MKWIAIVMVALLSACGTVQTTEVVQYRQVIVEPVMDTVVIEDEPVVEVTETEVDFY